MYYILTGFSHDLGFRVFTFETMDDPGTRGFVISGVQTWCKHHDEWGCL